jgi:hypothetical protein
MGTVMWELLIHTHTNIHMHTYTQSDVWAMGTVMWELAMERPPWENVKGEVHKKLIQLVAKEGKRLSVPPEGVIPDGMYVCMVYVSTCINVGFLLKRASASACPQRV